MAEKIVLCISADQATVARLKRGRLSECRVFPAGAAGLTEFDAYLDGSRGTPVLVMVDAVEEEYRFEMLPHASGSDRSELVGRRLKQLFRNTPYCAASLQGRDTGKRRDDLYLFFALTNPELVEDWLKIVRAHELPVAGVYLLPLVSRAAVEKLRLQSTNLLLVSRHGSGLRLTFFRQGQLRISRLTRAESDESQGATAIYTEEVANTRLYLHALRVMSLEEPLTVVLLDRDDSMADLATAIAREVTNVQVARLSPPDIVARLGIPADTLAASPDALFLHLLGSRPPQGNLAPAPVTATFHEYQIRRALYGLAGATAAVTLAWTALNAWQIYDLRSERSLAELQTSQYQRRYQEVTGQFPPAPTSPDDLVRSVEVAERIRKNVRDPAAALSLLGRTLEQFPQFTLKSVGWRYGTRDIGVDGAVARRPEAKPDPAQAPGSAVGLRRESAVIDAEVRPFDGNFRQAIADINAFAQRLRASSGVAEVIVTELPLNVSPTTALSGSTADPERSATSAPFRMVVVFKAGA